LAPRSRSDTYICATWITCDDYRAGAIQDSQLQEEDQKEGRKIESDVLVLISKGYLGGRHDVEIVWSEWMGQNGKLEVHGIERGVGHFVAEEEPEETARVVRSFYERHVSVVVRA
jgi:pimeloyl-ACP methyl ester carboxylesterase